MTQVLFSKSVSHYKANTSYDIKPALADFFVNKVKVATFVPEAVKSEVSEEDFSDLVAPAAREPARKTYHKKDEEGEDKPKRKRARKATYETREMKAED